MTRRAQRHAQRRRAALTRRELDRAVLGGDAMKPKDYRSDLEPVWCTGCGDFGVLKGLTQALATSRSRPRSSP